MDEKLFAAWQRYITGPEVQRLRNVVGRVLGEDDNYYYDIVADKIWSCITDRKYILTKQECHVVLDITIEVETKELTGGHDVDGSSDIRVKLTPAVKKALAECGLTLMDMKFKVEPLNCCKDLEDIYFIQMFAKTDDRDLMRNWDATDEEDMQYIVRLLTPKVIETIDGNGGVSADGVFISTVYNKYHHPDVQFNGLLPSWRVTRELSKLFTECINYRGGIKRIFEVYAIIVTNYHIGIRFKITPDNTY